VGHAASNPDSVVDIGYIKPAQVLGEWIRSQEH